MKVGWSLNLPPTLDHLARSFAILPSYAVPVLQHMPGWWRAHPGRSCFLARPIRDRRSSRAHVRTNAARARTCRGGVVSASISSIRRIQFSKGNRRRPLWAESVLRRRVGTPPVRPFTAVRPTGALRPTEASKPLSATSPSRRNQSSWLKFNLTLRAPPSAECPPSVRRGEARGGEADRADAACWPSLAR